MTPAADWSASQRTIEDRNPMQEPVQREIGDAGPCAQDGRGAALLLRSLALPEGAQ